MATVIPISNPVNDAERAAIGHLRDRLPNGYTVLHNFEVHRGGEVFEVDLAVLAPHAVYLVDVKGTHGQIDVYGGRWHSQWRAFHSPLPKLRMHAKAVKGLITATDPGRRDLEGVHVEGVVLLTAPDAKLVDPSGQDAPFVTTLAKSAGFFQDASPVPGNRSRSIGGLHGAVLRALQGMARKRSGPERFGNWVVDERLGAGANYVEYRAHNEMAGPRSGSVVLRVYRADPYLPAPEREEQRKRIGNAYLALSRLPSHPAILGARDFFPTEHEDGYVLVTDDAPGRALRVHLERADLALTFDQKARVAADLLGALAHAHAHGVIHRNVSPSTVLFGQGGGAKLTGFDFARTAADRSFSVAEALEQEAEPAYLAPECRLEHGAAVPASDVFSAGAVLYELFAGEPPYSSTNELFDRSAVFGLRPSEHRPDLPPGLDGWLQSLCQFSAGDRPSAAAALEALGGALGQAAPAEPEEGSGAQGVNYWELPAGYQLTRKFVVQERLGRGSFGVVYKVIDTLGDVTRAAKLIMRDRTSTLERLKIEYRTLTHLPPHPRVVRVLDADVLPGEGPPFIVFEYIEGLDVGELVQSRALSAGEALELGRQVAEGLAHLHANGVYHCDVKPRNLLWTNDGARIIDFNVAVGAEAGGGGGGTRRYLPPDLDLGAGATPAELADRDVYALGLTLYEAATGRYPWETAGPPPGEPPTDPRGFSGSLDLSPELVGVLLRAAAPHRADRYPSAAALLEALAGVRFARTAPPPPAPEPALAGPTPTAPFAAARPNANPFVDHLLTLYSQSRRTNSGTRGLDEFGEATYVQTALDRQLLPAALNGEFDLVVITGNAGDGKTAFIQQLERSARERGAAVATGPNGSSFALGGRSFLSNLDGSQDEGDRGNDEVLAEFLAPFGDGAPPPGAETRLIAINEGRLVDFLATHRERFSRLRSAVEEGLRTGEPRERVAVVNLNLRSVVSEPGSIFERQLALLTEPRFWEACEGCDLKERCYALHNARTFQDPTAGPKVRARLGTLYKLVHLRGRFHVTLRDLRSALAFTLVSDRSCEEIHELYALGRRDEYADGFYFSSFMGGERDTNDRLLAALRPVDPARGSDPRLDRALDFSRPGNEATLFDFERRGRYDAELLAASFERLPRAGGVDPAERFRVHRRFLALARRRRYFERLDEGWAAMLPYRSAEHLLGLVSGEGDLGGARDELVRAISRGEGLADPGRLPGRLALRVREVENGTVGSYRLFPAERFSLQVRDEAARARFVEHLPSGLRLEYRDGDQATVLEVGLDVFEMLERLNDGYRASVEELLGYHQSLEAFKNALAAQPYQEVLLATGGPDFYRIERRPGGGLEMTRLAQGA